MQRFRTKVYRKNVEIMGNTFIGQHKCTELFTSLLPKNQLSTEGSVGLLAIWASVMSLP